MHSKKQKTSSHPILTDSIALLNPVYIINECSIRVFYVYPEYSSTLFPEIRPTHALQFLHADPKVYVSIYKHIYYIYREF